MSPSSPDEPTTPRPPVLPEACRDELSTSVPVFYKAFVLPICAEDTLDMPEQTTEDLQPLVIRDEAPGGKSRKRVGENESDRADDPELAFTRVATDRIADALEESTKTPLPEDTVTILMCFAVKLSHQPP